MKANNDQTDLFVELNTELPPFVTREVAAQKLGGALTARTLSNLDAAGKGPRKVRIGKKVCYPRSDFLEWLKGVCSVC